LKALRGVSAHGRPFSSRPGSSGSGGYRENGRDCKGNARRRSGGGHDATTAFVGVIGAVIGGDIADYRPWSAMFRVRGSSGVGAAADG